MTIREVIHTYLHWLSSTGDLSDDNTESSFAIYNALLKSRATILSQALTLGVKISEESYQVLPCIELVEVDRVECPFIPASGCTWLKSTCPLPDFIKIQSISRQLGDGYSHVRWDKVKEKVGGRLKSAAKERFYSLRTIGNDTYLYIYNDETIKSITVTAIFEDPMEAALYCGVNEEAKCNPMDTSFHTPQVFIDNIIKQTWDSTIRVRAAAKIKVLNNDSPVDQTTQVPQKG